MCVFLSVKKQSNLLKTSLCHLTKHEQKNPYISYVCLLVFDLAVCVAMSTAPNLWGINLQHLQGGKSFSENRSPTRTGACLLPFVARSQEWLHCNGLTKTDVGFIPLHSETDESMAWQECHE